MSSPKISGFGVFNPFSKQFKQAQKVFYEDLSDRERAVVVIAAILGGPFFIVGGFATFCWTVRIMQPSEKSKSAQTSLTVDRIASEALPPPKPSSAEKLSPPAVISSKKANYSHCSIIQTTRFTKDNFIKLKKLLAKKGLDFKSYAGSDPGPNEIVIIFDFWGRPGGNLKLPSEDLQATILYVIVSPTNLRVIPSSTEKIHVMQLTWDPDFYTDKLDTTELKKLIKRAKHSVS